MQLRQEPQHSHTSFSYSSGFCSIIIDVSILLGYDKTSHKNRDLKFLQDKVGLHCAAWSTAVQE